MHYYAMVNIAENVIVYGFVGWKFFFCGHSERNIIKLFFRTYMRYHDYAYAVFLCCNIFIYIFVVTLLLF